MTETSAAQRRAAANAVAVQRIADTQPILTGIATGREALGLGEGELGHAGPPFRSTGSIPAAVLGALAGAVVHEGWADSLLDATRMVLDGAVRLRPNHDLGTVSPMAGVVRPGQTLVKVENRDGGGVTYATLAESGRRVLRFGVYDEGVAAGLRWLDETLAPALARALPAGGLELWPIVAEGVALGDDVHQRNVGTMYAFVRALDRLDGSFRAWLLGNPQHALNYAMASAKLALDQAAGIADSSIVTGITRNGVDCGIRMAATGNRWFTAPATTPEGGFFAPFELRDAQADLGDSAIMEAYGLGGAVAHVAPELARSMGRDWEEARQAGHRMRALFRSANKMIAPALAGPDGVGLGLDAQRVASGLEAIRIHTGIAHRDGQTGWIGLGVAFAPVECFSTALNELDGISSPGYLHVPKAGY